MRSFAWNDPKVRDKYITKWWDIDTTADALRKVVGMPVDTQATDQRKWTLEPLEIRNVLKMHLPMESHILEVGCGIGRVTRHISVDHYIVGTDVSALMLRYNNHLKDRLVLGLPFAVDAILCVYVLQHCPPEVMDDVADYFNANDWRMLFLLETTRPSDFPGYNFRDGLYERLNCDVIEEFPWEFEPHVTFVVLQRRQAKSV